MDDEFLRSVEESLASVTRMPEAHAIVHKNIRRALTRRFPFSIYYRLENNEVIIPAVHHSRRDPKRWRSRG